MKRLLAGVLLVVLILCGCNEGIAENTAPRCQYNYLTGDLSAYGEIDKTRLGTLTLTMPAEYAEADDEEKRHMQEQVVVTHLMASVTIHGLVEEDVAYQRVGLVQYFEAMRLYDNAIIEQYGDPADCAESLTIYLMRSFDLSSAEAVETALTEAAEALARENLAVALAYHELGLTVTEEARARTAASLAAEHGNAPTDAAYIDNEVLYGAVMEHLLDPIRCRIVLG